MSKKPSSTPPLEPVPAAVTVSFDKPHLLAALFGAADQNLIALEGRLGVYISARGNRLTIQGDADLAKQARDVLVILYNKVEQRRGGDIDIEDIDEAIALGARAAAVADAGGVQVSDLPPAEIRTRRKTIVPRSPTQIRYMHALNHSEIVFALGPAGTGKTYIAVAQAVQALTAGAVDRIILSRPAVEAGERLGFLPGDMKEKVDPYLRPLYDALYDMLPADQVERRIAAGDIEIAPIAFMRGRTLSNAFVILDEAQNTTSMQMKMFLTRFGQRSRMVVCGDPSQTDLAPGIKSGLADAVRRLEHVQGIAMVRFSASEVVRHPLVGRIVDAYDDETHAGA
jgi:phosphate starvation-inducible protein PhoH and related proteins